MDIDPEDSFWTEEIDGDEESKPLGYLEAIRQAQNAEHAIGGHADDGDESGIEVGDILGEMEGFEMPGGPPRTPTFWNALLDAPGTGAPEHVALDVETDPRDFRARLRTPGDRPPPINTLFGKAERALSTRLTPEFMFSDSGFPMEYLLHALDVSHVVVTGQVDGRAFSRHMYERAVSISHRFDPTVWVTIGSGDVFMDLRLVIVPRSLYVAPYMLYTTGPWMFHRERVAGEIVNWLRISMGDLIASAHDAIESRIPTHRLRMLGLRIDRGVVSTEVNTAKRISPALVSARVATLVSFGVPVAHIRVYAHDESRWHEAAAIVLSSDERWAMYAPRTDQHALRRLFLRAMHIVAWFVRVLDTEGADNSLRRNVGTRLFYGAPTYRQFSVDREGTRVFLKTLAITARRYAGATLPAQRGLIDRHFTLLKHLFDTAADAVRGADQTPYVRPAPGEAVVRFDRLAVTVLSDDRAVYEFHFAFPSSVDAVYANYRAAKLVLVWGAYMEQVANQHNYHVALNMYAHALCTTPDGEISPPSGVDDDAIYDALTDGWSERRTAVVGSFDASATRALRRLNAGGGQSAYVDAVAQWRRLGTVDYMHRERVPLVQCYGGDERVAELRQLTRGFLPLFDRTNRIVSLRLDPRAPNTLYYVEGAAVPARRLAVVHSVKAMGQVGGTKQIVPVFREPGPARVVQAVTFIATLRRLWRCLVARRGVESESNPMVYPPGYGYIRNHPAIALARSLDVIVRPVHLSGAVTRLTTKSAFGFRSGEAAPYTFTTKNFFQPVVRGGMSSFDFGVPTDSALHLTMSNAHWPDLEEEDKLLQRPLDAYAGTLHPDMYHALGYTQTAEGSLAYSMPIEAWLGPVPDWSSAPKQGKHRWFGAIGRGQAHLLSDLAYGALQRSGNWTANLRVKRLSEAAVLTLRRAMLTQTISIVPLFDAYYLSVATGTDNSFSLGQDIAELYLATLTLSNRRFPTAMDLLSCDLFALATAMHSDMRYGPSRFYNEEYGPMIDIQDEYMTAMPEVRVGLASRSGSPWVYTQTGVTPAGIPAYDWFPFELDVDSEDYWGARAAYTEDLGSGVGEIRHFLWSVLTNVIDPVTAVLPASANPVHVHDILEHFGWPVFAGAGPPPQNVPDVLIYPLTRERIGEDVDMPRSLLDRVLGDLSGKREHPAEEESQSPDRKQQRVDTPPLLSLTPRTPEGDIAPRLDVDERFEDWMGGVGLEDYEPDFLAMPSIEPMTGMPPVATSPEASPLFEHELGMLEWEDLDFF